MHQPAFILYPQLLISLASFNSINQWISSCSEPTRQACNICNLPFYLKYTFENIPEFLVFDFGGLNDFEINKSFLLNKDGIQYLFKLRGVIYFSQNHFTSRVITRSGQIWFHDPAAFNEI